MTSMVSLFIGWLQALAAARDKGEEEVEEDGFTIKPGKSQPSIQP